MTTSATTAASSTTQLLEAALAYAQAGYQVFPLRGKLPRPNCPECDPRSPYHRPHPGASCAGTAGHQLCHGLLAATTDLEHVERWWTRRPNRNIGARVPASLLVLDIDPRSGGEQSLTDLEAAHGPLPATRTSYSGRGDGGRHLWWLHPGGKPSATRLGSGLDLKGDGGYVLLPPSRHPDTGQPYRWAAPVLAPAPVPAWLRGLLLPPAPTPPRRTTPRIAGNASNLIEQFTAQTSWAAILEPHRWTCLDQDGDADGARWRAPDVGNSKSATIRHGCLFVYSQATTFEATEAGSPHGYTKFRAWALLEHGGDAKAAWRALQETAR